MTATIGHNSGTEFPYREYLETTRNLTLAERGVYATIIVLSMTGPVQDDDAMMATVVNAGVPAWLSHKARLLKLKKIRIKRGLIVPAIWDEVSK
jgi:hypothetical protein